MTVPKIDWENLQAEYPRELVVELRRFLDQAGPLELETEDLTAEVVGVGADVALALLRKVASFGVLLEERRFKCPNCPETLSLDELNGGICPHCESHFDSGEPQPEEIFVFLRKSAPSRDVRWVLLLHGMNTRGAWQEEFNWLVSTSYAHAVPVAIYKYGIVRPGAFFRFRHRSLARELASKIERLSGVTAGTGFGKRPDVVAHSLGTLLLNIALRRNSSLEVGRVILLGSIIRPDSNWRDLIDNGQVRAILNHYGTKDFWARVAHYFIPDSGPSGRIGFNSNCSSINAAAEGFGHSDFFKMQHLSKLFETLWRPFLTSPEEALSKLGGTANTRHWGQTWWPLRANAPRFLLVGFGVVLVGIFLLSLGLGLLRIVAWFNHAAN